MATYKPYRKTTNGKEEIKIPYSVLSNPPAIPTSIDGLGGGTLTSPIKLTGGDGAAASKMILTSNGQITDTSTSTLFGFSSGNLIVGHGRYPLTMRGKQARPTWNGKDLALKSDIPDVSGKLDKTAFEENKTINFGDTGVLKIGKFKVYDTNVTCEITSTTSLTYSGKLVIACQNYIIKKMTVYGDAANTVAPNIFVKPSTTSDPYIEVYFKPPSWSKNVIHIYGSAIAEAPTDVCTNVAELPSVATEKPINALTYLAAGDGGYSLNASGYVKGSWLQSSAMSNKGSNTGKVCVFDDNGWIYYRTPAEILAEAGGGVGGGGITPFCMDDLSTGTFSSTTLGRSTTTTALYFEDRETSVYGVLYGGVYSTTKLYYLTDVSYSTTSLGSKYTFVFTKYTTNNDKLIKNTDKIELVSGKATYNSQTNISGTFYYKILK